MWPNVMNVGGEVLHYGVFRDLSEGVLYPCSGQSDTALDVYRWLSDHSFGAWVV